MNKQKGIHLSIVLLVTTIFFITSSLFAQQHPKPTKIPSDDQINQMIEDLSAELSLSKKQQNSILTLYTDHFHKVKKKVEQHKENKKLEKKEMAKNRSDFEEEVKSLLSEEQQVTFNKFIEKERRHHRKGRPNHN
jgi:gas vesicle protein